MPTEFSCPWSFLEPALLSFCEAKRCSWIAEPMNTLSNLSFVLIGLYLLWAYRKNHEIAFFGVSAIIVGITSAFYHASSSFIGERFDLGCMCIFMAGVVLFNLHRAGILKRHHIVRKAFILGFASTTLMFLVDWLTIEIFSLLMTAALVVEVYIYIKRKEKPDQVKNFSYKFLFLGLGTHSLAYVFWLLDYHHIVCEPYSIFQGHAIWHFLGGFTFLFLTKFYIQFYGKNSNFFEEAE